MTPKGQITIRLTPLLLKEVDNLLKVIKKVNPFAKRSDVIRDLLTAAIRGAAVGMRGAVKNGRKRGLARRAPVP